MSKILKHLGFGKKPPMPPRVDYNMRAFLGLGMPIRCNSEGNLLEAVAEERAINKMTHRSQDDTQLVLVPDYCDPADLKEQFRKEMGARRKAAAAKVALSKNAVGTLDDDFYSTPYETQRVGKDNKGKAAPTSPSVASSSSPAPSKGQTEGQQRAGNNSKSTPPPPAHQHPVSSSASSASTASHAEPGGRHSRQTDEAAVPEPCDEEDAGDVQYCDPWDSGPAAAALRLLRGEDVDCPPSAAVAATAAAPAPASAALSADEMARQRHIYETAFDSRVRQREPEMDLDRLAQSPVLAGLGPAQNNSNNNNPTRVGPLFPVPGASGGGAVAGLRKVGGAAARPTSSGSSSASSLQDGCPKPPPHQGSSGSGSSQSGASQQPMAAPRGSSSGVVPVPAARGQPGHGKPSMPSADKAIYQNHPLPQSPGADKSASQVAMAVKRSIHAGGIKVLPSEPVRRTRHNHRREGEPMALAPVLLNGFQATSSDNVSSSSSSDNSPRKPDEKRGRHAPPLPHALGALHNGAQGQDVPGGFRASASVDSLSNSSSDSPRKPEEKRGRLVAVAPPTVLNGVAFRPTSSSSADAATDINADRRPADKRMLACRGAFQPQPQSLHSQSPSSDTRPEGDYDRPWDLPRLKHAESPPQVPGHRVVKPPALHSPTQANGTQVMRLPSPEAALAASTPTASSSREPPCASPAPSSSAAASSSASATTASSSSSSTTSIAMEPPAPVRPNAPARPSLNLNLNLNASNSPKRSRHNLTLNFGCAALSVVGEKVDPSVALEKQGWYHGSISRLDAENLLRVLKEGSYLVRNSESSKHDYSLSLKSARGFMHMKIVHNEDGKFILGQFSKPFESIPEMIHHYSVNKLPIKGAEHMSLLYPVIDQLL